MASKRYYPKYFVDRLSSATPTQVHDDIYQVIAPRGGYYSEAAAMLDYYIAIAVHGKYSYSEEGHDTTGATTVKIARAPRGKAKLIALLKTLMRD